VSLHSPPCGTGARGRWGLLGVRGPSEPPLPPLRYRGQGALGAPWLAAPPRAHSNAMHLQAGHTILWRQPVITLPVRHAW